jgi:hypothetical protein
MPNAIKYSASAQTLALKKGNFYIGTGDVGKGPTSTTDYYNGITPPAGGYTIYLNKASGGPSIYTAANDSALISLSNTIAGQTFATAAAALAWFATQTDKMVFNIDYPAIITDGLVLNLDAGFTPSYPTTGTTWYDVSSGGNNGTLTNGPTFSSANGGSIVFDGSDDKVICPNNSNINFDASQSFTTCCWVYLTATSGYEVFIAKHTPAGTGYIPNLLWQGSTPELRWWLNNTVDVTYSSNKTYLNQWRFVCMSVGRPSNIGYIFEDGILVSSGSVNSNSLSNSEVLQIGNDYYGSALSGRISIVQIYNRLLSPSEVLQNYNATKSRFGL